MPLDVHVTVMRSLRSTPVLRCSERLERCARRMPASFKFALETRMRTPSEILAATLRPSKSHRVPAASTSPSRLQPHSELVPT